MLLKYSFVDPGFVNYLYKKTIENMHSHKLRSTKSKTFYSKQGKTKQYRGWITYAGVDHWSEINLSLKDLSLKTLTNKKRYSSIILIHTVLHFAVHSLYISLVLM